MRKRNGFSIIEAMIALTVISILIASSAHFLSKKSNYEFRTTLINEFHKRENVIRIAEWIKGANKYFLQRFKLGDNCLDADNLSPVDNQTTLEYLEILRKYIPNTQTRGYDF